MRFIGQAQGPVPDPAVADMVNYTGGLMIGPAAWAAAPGNYKGPGTVHAERAVYDGNVQLSDHVFDLHFDGRPREGEEDKARRYLERHVELDQLRAHLAAHRSLPTMPGRQEWTEHGPASLGELATGLWQTVESQALYIAELEQRLNALEDEAFADGLSEGELQRLLQQVERSPYMSDLEKTRMRERLMARANTPNSNR